MSLDEVTKIWWIFGAKDIVPIAIDLITLNIQRDTSVSESKIAFGHSANDRFCLDRDEK